MISELDVGRLKSLVDSRGISQSDLVRASGISRSQIGRLLTRPQPRVRQDTLQRLAQALRVSPVELVAGGAIRRFTEHVAKENAALDFRGIGMPGRQPQAIQEIFVDPPAEEDFQHGHDDCLETTAESARAAATRRTQPISATECVRTYDRVVVLGNPGCGKTTLLRFLAHSHATRDEGDTEVPIYIRLPELCRAMELEQGVDAVRLVAARAAGRETEQCLPEDMEQCLREELQNEKRRCLVLLDGLDEVGEDGQKERLIKCVQEFVERYPQNRYAVTSRIIGFEAAAWRRQGFAVFRILGYREEQLRTFAEKWAKVRSRSENKPYEEILQTLKTAIFANRRVRALASNPLMLTILVLLNEARGGTLPRRRVDLYEKVVDVFLDTWESNKHHGDTFDDTQGIDMDAREFRWLLCDLSLAMQRAGRTLAARWWIADRMQECLQQKVGLGPEEAKDACDRIIRYLAERTGLIEERGPDTFGFSHRTIQEYFAALGLIDEADASPSRDVTGCMRGYYFHPQWSEVVRLVAARLTPALAESLISSILDDPDPVGRFLRRGQLLVLRCLSDGTTVANRGLVATVFDKVAELGRSRWLGITLEAIRVLKSFEGTRHQKPAQDALEAILDTARTGLDDDEFECLYEWVYLQEILAAARQELPAEFKTEAARETSVTVRNKPHRVVHFNSRLLSEDPDAWCSSACRILEAPDQGTRLKKALVRELGRKVADDRRAFVALQEVLRSGTDASIRAACALALGSGAKAVPRIKGLLLQALDEDSDDEVRAACAIGLRDAAVEDKSVRHRLIEIFDSDQPASVRGAAARGLAEAAVSEASLFERLCQSVSNEVEPEDVRTSCAWALAGQIGEKADLTDLFKTWLSTTGLPKLQQIAAQALTTAMVEERLQWDHQVVEKIEGILINLERPCSHALERLGKLATAREVRRGLRLENVLRDSLRPVADAIELAFVFGSTARNRQTDQSDVDLLVIGSVTLKGLSGPLGEAERVLGRRVNPAIYTQEVFRTKYQAGDPFLLDVYRREKIPIVQPEGDSPRADLDDELRAMVAEHVA